MSAERHARTKRLFEDALDRPRGERDAFLLVACGDDAALLAEVRGMLAVEESAPDFLATPATGGLLAAAAAAARDAAPPERIGPFRIVRLLGEGGMGAVFEAEQDRPRRRVALKLLHPGAGAAPWLRRFELESEVLGRLEHPGIARLYEAGASDSGHGAQPWFAMELVDGDPLTDTAERRRLPLPARLELLALVCDAVQHAHQRGIVHRDLKPANVLVTADGQPKVLDFGIARAVGGELQAATLRTAPGMVVGTLQYMSPEQARADPDAIDVRTDVWSLGVMLWELVAGRPPHDVTGVPLHEALRRVIEDEPPSLRAVARAPADVAAIAQKALARDKDRRYASAGELAADLRRFLRREPIAAQATGRWYRVQRFVARNRAVVAGTMTTFVALVAGLSIALWQRDEAREALACAEGINRYLLGDLLASPSPEKLGRDVRVVDVLAPAVRSAERAFAGRPRVAAEVLTAVGGSYRALGLAPDAEPITRRAIDLLADGGEDRLSLRARGQLVAVLTDLDRSAESVALGERVVADCTRLLGRDDPDTLARRVELAVARWSAGQHETAVGELRQVAEDQARVLGDEDPRTLQTRAELAGTLVAHGDVAQAQRLLADTLAVQDRVLGPEHPATLATRGSLCWILTLAGSWPEAEAAVAQLVPALASVYGPRHPFTAQTRILMVQCLLHLGRQDEAATIGRDACEDLERVLGPVHGWTLDGRLMLAEVLFRRGDHAAAIAESTRVVELRRQVGGEHLGHALIKLGRCHQEAGDARAAAATFREAADVYRTAFGKPTDFLAQALYNLGVATRDAGDPQAAIAPLREALELDAAEWGASHRHVIADRSNLARTLLAAGRPELAVEELRAALAAATVLDYEPARLLEYRAMLGGALLAAGRHDEGERELRDVAGEAAALGEAGATASRRARAALVRYYDAAGRAADADRYRDPVR